MEGSETAAAVGQACPLNVSQNTLVDPLRIQPRARAQEFRHQRLAGLLRSTRRPVATAATTVVRQHQQLACQRRPRVVARTTADSITDPESTERQVGAMVRREAVSAGVEEHGLSTGDNTDGSSRFNYNASIAAARRVRALSGSIDYARSFSAGWRKRWPGRHYYLRTIDVCARG